MFNLNLSQCNLDNFIFWPKWLQVKIIILACLLLFIFGYFLNLRQQLDKLHALKTLNLHLENKIKVRQTALPPVYEKMKPVLPNNSINSLKMAGFLKKDTQCWGLINTLNGGTYKIELGELIGSEKAKVITINKDSITVSISISHDKQQKKIKKYIK